MEGQELFARERPTVGLVLRDTFSLFSAHMPQFLGITMLTMAPMALVIVLVLAAAATTAAAPGPQAMTAMVGALVLGVLLFLLGAQLSSAAFTYGVFQIERGLPLRVGDCLGIAWRRLPIVLLIGIVVGILTSVGLLLCVVPGILIALRLSLAVPASVVERRSLGAALERSAELTTGFRGIVFGAFVVVGLLQYAIGMLIGAVGLASAVLSNILSFLSYVVFAGLQATSVAVLYYRLRAAKGALDVDEIAAVFE